MPLTEFQMKLAQLLASNRSEDSHLAGGAALHFHPHSIRYSDDLDYFHDSEARVASAFLQDRTLLEKNGYSYVIELSQPGYIRCIVKRGMLGTKIEWARDSSWRFMTVQKHPDAGYILHPIDLAINKLLALAGRDEPRDFIDVLHTHRNILPLGAQCWAACGKDPGFSPNSLLELLKRRGKNHPSDFERLHLVEKIDVHDLKARWLTALSEAEIFANQAPTSDLGCLYYSMSTQNFVEPDFRNQNKSHKDILLHFGQPGGVVPIIGK